tara:strand:+ start:200 stop:304 length:105 start_codon:yes stop_codon:yes gene_type:complete
VVAVVELEQLDLQQPMQQVVMVVMEQQVKLQDLR